MVCIQCCGFFSNNWNGSLYYLFNYGRKIKLNKTNPNLILFTILHKEDVGKRLDRYLVQKIKNESRSKIQNWIRSKLVLVNKLHKKTGYLLELEDEIWLKIPDSPPINSEKPEPIELNIVYEDDEIAVIDKPSGLVVHSGISNTSGTLVNGLLFHFKSLSAGNQSFRPGIIHRLDKETSGVIVIAKTDFAHSKISKQFQNREVEKKYIALTWGQWEKKHGFIDFSIGRNRKEPTSFIIDEKGKASLTKYSVEKQFRHLALVSFFPKTGRTHQIRVHSSSLGHPIFGDGKYGGGVSKAKGYLPEFTNFYKKNIKELDRHVLHAKEIKFKHPKNNKIMNFKAHLPKEILNLINSLETLYEKK